MPSVFTRIKQSQNNITESTSQQQSKSRVQCSQVEQRAEREHLQSSLGPNRSPRRTSPAIGHATLALCSSMHGRLRGVLSHSAFRSLYFSSSLIQCLLHTHWSKDTCNWPHNSRSEWPSVGESTGGWDAGRLGGWEVYSPTQCLFLSNSHSPSLSHTLCSHIVTFHWTFPFCKSRATAHELAPA